MIEFPVILAVFLFIVMLFGGFAKGTMGVGLIISTVPFLSVLIPPKDAMAWMAVPILFLNIYALFLTRAEWRQAPRIFIFLPACILFVPIGVRLVVWLPEDITRAAIGAGVFIVVAMRLGGWKPERKTEHVGRFLSVAWGAATGFIHGSLMMPAPPLVLYLNYIGASRDAFVFLLNCVSTTLILTQIASFAGLGAYASGAGWQSLFLLAPAVLGMWIGNRFRQSLSESSFERMVLSILGLVGITLVAKFIYGLL